MATNNQEEAVLIFGTRDDDYLFGNHGGDTIKAGPGDDVLDGGWGKDTLIGGKGADTFTFSDSAIDTVADFKPGTDIAQVFVGAYASEEVLAGQDWQSDWTLSIGGRHSADGDDLAIIYNPKNGKAFVDGDGAGSEAAVQFARFDSHLWLGRGDFLLS